MYMGKLGNSMEHLDITGILMDINGNISAFCVNSDDLYSPEPWNSD